MPVNSSVPDELRYDRQILAFGHQFQQDVAKLTVAVVGAGGVGSALVQSLAQLGVGRLLVVDPDTVSASNLNRMVGATESDARAHRAKVQVAQRVARQANPRVVTTVVEGSVLDDATWLRLRSADVLMGAVDGHAPRWAMNRLAVQYARCYIDVGVELGCTEVGGELEAGGHVAVVRPTGPCLLCMAGYEPRAVVTELDPELAQARRAVGYRSDNPDEPTPSVVFLNQVLAGYAVGELVNWIRLWRPATPYVLVDLMNAAVSPLQAIRDAECVACGSGSVRGMADAAGALGLV